MTGTREKLKGVTKAHPCPVCKGITKCSVGTEGMILCGREKGQRIHAKLVHIS
jgi:hypothetical protein